MKVSWSCRDKVGEDVVAMGDGEVDVLVVGLEDRVVVVGTREVADNPATVKV